MLKKILTLCIAILLLTACANTNDNTETPSPRDSNSSNASDGDPDPDSNSNDEPLPPITATLKIARTGVQIAGSETVNWSLSGEVEIVIPRESQTSSPPASPHLAKVLLLQRDDEEEEEDELQPRLNFTAVGEGSGSWSFSGSNCSGGGEFGLQYEVSGQYNPETGAIDMNLVENWTGGSSAVVCAGVASSGPIPPGVIPLNPIKMGACENGDAQVENKWVQHPEIYGGGISWFDQFTLEALELSGPDGADAASDLSADLYGDGDSGDTAEVDANATQAFESDPAVADADANVTPDGPDDPDTADSNADVTPDTPDDPDTADSNADVTPDTPDDPDTADSNADVTPESPDDPDTADSDASANPPLTSSCPDG